MKKALSLLITSIFVILCGCSTVMECSSPKIKVLAIGFYGGLRDCNDLEKSGFFEITRCPMGGSLLDNRGQNFFQRSFYWLDAFRTEADIEKELLHHLGRSPEIMIMTQRPAWKLYPKSVQNKILQNVEDGMVLSLIAPDKDLKDLLSRKWKKTSLKFDFKKYDKKDRFNFEIYQYGKGKVLVQPSFIDFRFGFYAPNCSQGEFDYATARQAELLRSVIQTQEKTVKTVRTRVFDSAGKVFEHTDNLPEGKYFVLNRSCDENGCIIRQTGSVFERKYDQGISGAKLLSSPDAKKGSPIKIAISYRKNSSGGSVKAFVRDTYGRVNIQKTFTGTPETIELDFPTGSITPVNIAEICYYNKKGNLINRATVEFTIPFNPRNQDFYFIAWNGSIGDSSRHREYLKLLKKSGIDAFSNMSPSENLLRLTAKANLSSIPYTAAFHQSRISRLLDAKRLSKDMESAVKAAQLGKRYGTLAHSLGDENYVTPFVIEGRFSNTEQAWREFRKYLQKVYSSLQELNSAWNRNFKNWNEIKFDSESQMFSYERPACWRDYRNFISTLFIQRQRELKDAIKKIDPEVFVGFEGSEQFSSYDGYDWYNYTKSFDMNNVYARSFNDKMLANKIFNGYAMRSFAAGKNLIGFWMNGIDYPTGLRTVPWETLFSGMNSLWWWHATIIEHENSPLDYYLRENKIFAAAAREVRKIKSGPATLLRNAVPQKPSVAIYYSADNFHASTLSANLGNHVNCLGADRIQWNRIPSKKVIGKEPDFRNMWGNHAPAGHYAPAFKSFATLLKDLNLDFAVIDGKEIASGALNSYRMLVLPFVEALSDKEADEIKKFVQEGGIVIADYRTGIRYQNCNFRKTGVLDDLFGIRQKYPFTVKHKMENIQVDTGMGDWITYFRYPVNFVGKGVAPDTAAGISDSGENVFRINSYGKGKTLYLNFDFYEYFELRKYNQESDIREFFRNLFTRHLNFPAFKVVTDNDDIPFAKTKVMRFSDRNAAYAGVLFDKNLNESSSRHIVKIPMLFNGHLYDVLNQKYLGYGNVAEIGIERGYAALIASMPEKITAPEIVVPSIIKRGEEFKCSIRMKNQPQSVRITIISPENKEVDHYTKNIYLPNGKGEYKFIPALNDVCGEWKIKVRDIVSGLQKEMSFVLK